MGKLLDKIAQDLNASGLKKRTPKARHWIRNEIGKLSIPRAAIVKDPMGTTNPFMGNMFFFAYDAKTKDDLPYWDKFPLVLILDLYADGFLGLNFHYLPLNQRIILLDRLYDLATDDKFDEGTRLTATYKLLKGVARYKAFEPCLKRYLSHHLQSRVIPIPADKWEIAIFLPVEQFQKNSARHVWAQSVEQIENS